MIIEVKVIDVNSWKDGGSHGGEGSGGALISGGGTNLQAILDACAADGFPAEVVFVGADNPQALGLARARSRGVPTFVVDYRGLLASRRLDPAAHPLPADFALEEVRAKQSLFPRDTEPERVDAYLQGRAFAEFRLLAAMQPHACDLLVLAGFMRNLTPYFIDRVNTDRLHPRIMNIHPALLPAFPGTDGYGDTFRYGCKIAGCTVHFVDYGEDSGPIIGQRAFPIAEEDTLEAVRRKGLEQEWALYPECIRLFAEGRLQIDRTHHDLGGGKTVDRAVVRVLPAPEK